jgi:integrase
MDLSTYRKDLAGNPGLTWYIVGYNSGYTGSYQLRSGKDDQRYLEKHNGKWRVTIGVPKDLQKKLGATRLKRGLKTDSLSVANVRKWPIIAEFQQKFILATARAAGDRAAVLQEASEIAAAASAYSTDVAERLLREFLEPRIPELIGMPVDRVFSTEVMPGAYEGEMIEETVAHDIYDPVKVQLAEEYAAIAHGAQLPIATDDADYKTRRLRVSPKTEYDHDRALKMLAQWCRSNAKHDDMRKVDLRVAESFVSWLEHDGKNHRTIKKYVSRLNRYFSYLRSKGRPVTNPWAEVRVYTPREEATDLERPFTEQEVVTLLTGDAAPEMLDLMMVAALTGARLDAIVDLKVEDIAYGKAFRFKAQKSEKSYRYVPIHSRLMEIVKRRTDGKQPADEFFPEFPPSSNAKIERSSKASKRFTTYRKSEGVHDGQEGRRRSRVNFHSWRRWFITKMKWARVDTDITAAIVGHAQKGVTLSVYFEGPEMTAAEEAIEKVMLPPLDGSPVHQPESVTPR